MYNIFIIIKKYAQTFNIIIPDTTFKLNEFYEFLGSQIQINTYY